MPNFIKDNEFIQYDLYPLSYFIGHNHRRHYEDDDDAKDIVIYSSGGVLTEGEVEYVNHMARERYGCNVVVPYLYQDHKQSTYTVDEEVTDTGKMVSITRTSTTGVWTVVMSNGWYGTLTYDTTGHEGELLSLFVKQDTVPHSNALIFSTFGTLGVDVNVGTIYIDEGTLEPTIYSAREVEYKAITPVTKIKTVDDWFRELTLLNIQDEVEWTIDELATEISNKRNELAHLKDAIDDELYGNFSLTTTRNLTNTASSSQQVLSENSHSSSTSDEGESSSTTTEGGEWTMTTIGSRKDNDGSSTGYIGQTKTEQTYDYSGTNPKSSATTGTDESTSTTTGTGESETNTTSSSTGTQGGTMKIEGYKNKDIVETIHKVFNTEWITYLDKLATKLVESVIERCWEI